MKELVTLPPFLALHLVDMLHEAGIPAETTEMQTGVMGVYPGLVPFTLTVWVLNAEDLEDANEVLEILRSQPPSMAECPECGYDLQGNAGEENCPECGASVHVEDTSDWEPCEQCGELSPPESEQCWRCTAPEVEEPTTPPVYLGTTRGTLKAGRVIVLLVLLSMVGGLIISIVNGILYLFS